MGRGAPVVALPRVHSPVYAQRNLRHLQTENLLQTACPTQIRSVRGIKTTTTELRSKHRLEEAKWKGCPGLDPETERGR